MIRRTRAYTFKDIPILWIVLNNGEINKDRFVPKWWHKWLHAAYFGKIYYWVSECYVVPVKLTQATTYVEQTEWGGGYEKILKRYKTPKKESIKNITTDFMYKRAKKWNYDKLSVPNRLIYTVID